MAVAMGGVARKRMLHAREVAPELVPPTGFRFQFDEREAAGGVAPERVEQIISEG